MEAEGISMAMGIWIWRCCTPPVPGARVWSSRRAACVRSPNRVAYPPAGGRGDGRRAAGAGNELALHRLHYDRLPEPALPGCLNFEARRVEAVR